LVNSWPNGNLGRKDPKLNLGVPEFFRQKIISFPPENPIPERRRRMGIMVNLKLPGLKKGPTGPIHLSLANKPPNPGRMGYKNAEIAYEWWTGWYHNGWCPHIC